VTTITIPVDKIGAVIGPGGKMIRSIVEETKATIDVQDDGAILIASTDEAATRRAIEIIENLTKEAKVGDIYTGRVVRTLDFGAFVEILPGKDGMVHISELSEGHVPTVEDVVKVGDEITVVVIGVDPSGRVALSRRALLEDSEGSGDAPSRPADGTGAASSTERRGPPSGPRGGRGGDDRPRGGGRPSGYRGGQRPQGGGRGPRPGQRYPGGGPPR
jgi:polyribonucleotide nucleotidyltransferase